MKKISQRSDDFFTFRCYHLDDGEDAVRVWLARQEAAVRADVLVAMKTLREQPQKWWRKKRFEELGQRGQKECQGLVEIKIWKNADDEKEHFRILGYYGPGERQVTLLMAFRKNDDPDYSKSCPEAQARKAKIDHEPARSRDCHF